MDRTRYGCTRKVAVMSKDSASEATDNGPADDGDHPSNAELLAAALAKKKQAGQARAQHLDGANGVGGQTASHKATRTFRRKSG
jgi:hypothetical protein